MATTTYIVTTNGVADSKPFSRKDKAISAAEGAFAAGAKSVSVATAAGTVVFSAAKSKRYAKPFTRVVNLSPEHAELVPAGYVAAYERVRNGAVVLRRETDEPEDDSRYAVLDTTNGVLAGFGATTRHVGAIMKSLGNQHKSAAKA